MSLYDKFKSITKEKWQYYRSINFSEYDETIARPSEFIRTYFELENKNEFLFKSLFCDEQEDYHKQKEYYNGIKQLSDWFNFVETNEDGQEININFYNDKNIANPYI